MKFKVSVYPLNFYLVNKTFKTNNTSFRSEKMKVLLTQSEKEKFFEGGGRLQKDLYPNC